MSEIFSIGVNIVLILSGIICLFIIFSFLKANIIFKMLGFYFITSTIIDSIASGMAYYGENNLFILHFHTLFEFLILSIIYYKIIESISLKRFISVFSIIGIILIIINSSFIQSIEEFNSYASGFVSISILGYSMIYFFQLLNNPSTSREEITLKWIIISIFIFHNVNFIALLFSNNLLSISSQYFSIVFLIRLIIIIISKLIILTQYILLSKHIYQTAR